MGTGGPFALKTLTKWCTFGVERVALTLDSEPDVCVSKLPAVRFPEVQQLQNKPFGLMVHLQGFEPGTH